MGKKHRKIVLPRPASELTVSWTEQLQDTAASTFLLLLLVADCAFIVLHFLALTVLSNYPLLLLHVDQGYPEFFQYIKELWIVGLLLSLTIRTKAVGYSVWALLFLYLLIDDSLRIHETYGEFIAARLEFTPFLGLRAKDFGELAVSATAGGFFITLLALFYLNGSAAFKQTSRHLLLLLFALALFGIFFDMVHLATMGRWTFSYLLGIVEDGGEMIVMSVMAWYAFLLNLRKGNLASSLRSTR